MQMISMDIGSAVSAVSNVSVGGRNYRAVAVGRSTIVSRDTRTQELQQITRIRDEEGAEYREDDETCVREIDWMLKILHYRFNVVLMLESAQSRIKHGASSTSSSDDTPQSTDLGISLLRDKLYKAAKTLKPKLTAKVADPDVMLGPLETDHLRAKLSGPMQAFFKVGRDRRDVELERWHLVLACWATCQTLLEIPCKVVPFGGLGVRALVELRRCVHERLLAHSLLKVNLIDWPLHTGDENKIDLKRVHLTAPNHLPPSQGDDFADFKDIEKEVKELWFRRLVASRNYCCLPHSKVEPIILTGLWKYMEVTPRLIGARAYLETQQRQCGQAHNDQPQAVVNPDENSRVHTNINPTSTADFYAGANDHSDPIISSTAIGRSMPNTEATTQQDSSNDEQTSSLRSDESHPELLTSQALLKTCLLPGWEDIEKNLHKDTLYHALRKKKPEDKFGDYCWRNMKAGYDKRWEQHASKSYIVVGWFPGTMVEPIEACMWYVDEEEFLSALKRQISRLRGWRKIFSLKTVQAFGLYKCDLEHRCHTNYQCSPAEKTILAQLYNACYRMTFRKQRRESAHWADWVRLNLNNNTASPDGRLIPMPLQCHRSLKLIIKWSRVRLTLAAIIPLALSFIIGFWYNYTNDDVQTAWTIASYIVTASAFALALLAILTSLQDGGADLGWALTARNRNSDDIELQDASHTA